LLYNIIKENGKKAYIIQHQTTPFKVVEDLLQTDYLGNILNDVLEEEGEYDPTLTKGTVISNRKALKKRLAREGIMVDLVLNRFLEEEIPLEQYLFLQQYVGSFILNNEGAEKLELKIKRGVYEEYFRKKGIKLANINRGAKWYLESVRDIVWGKCTLGHDIRYAFTAVSNMGDRVVFGSTCVHDFFDIDAQLHERLNDYVEQIKDITDEYYNDYHAYYEVHAKLDGFFRILVLFIDRLTHLYTKQEVGYVNTFANYNLPIPRPLARQLGVRIHVFLTHNFNYMFFPDMYRSVKDLIYMLHCFAQGSHGYTLEDLNGYFPTNFLGDRIMPKEVKQLTSLMKSRYTAMGSKEFVNQMALQLTDDMFMNVLNNLYQLKQLTEKLQHSEVFGLFEENPQSLVVVHKPTGIILSKDLGVVETLFGIPSVDELTDALGVLVNHKLNLKIDLDALNTAKVGFLGRVGRLGKRVLLKKDLTELNRDAVEFLNNYPRRIQAEDVVLAILWTNYLDESNPSSLEWFKQVLTHNGLGQAYEQFLKQKSERIDLDKLLEKVEENIDAVEKKGLTFARDVLISAVRSGSASEKQMKYIKQLNDFISKGIVPNSSNELTNEYKALLDKANRHKDLLKKNKLDFNVKVLETVSKTGRVTPKQRTFIDKLKSFLDTI
jgi:hypothetical protein